MVLDVSVIMLIWDVPSSFVITVVPIGSALSSRVEGSASIDCWSTSAFLSSRQLSNLYAEFVMGSIPGIAALYPSPQYNFGRTQLRHSSSHLLSLMGFCMMRDEGWFCNVCRCSRGIRNLPLSTLYHNCLPAHRFTGR